MTLLMVPSFLPLFTSLLPVLLLHTQRPSVDSIKNYSNDGLVLSLNAWVLGTLWPPGAPNQLILTKATMTVLQSKGVDSSHVEGLEGWHSKSKDLHVWAVCLWARERQACLAGHLAGRFHGCFSLQLSQGMPQPSLKKIDTYHFEILRQIKKALSCKPRHFSDLNC